jgi:hypothetical protein
MYSTPGKQMLFTQSTGTLRLLSFNANDVRRSSARWSYDGTSMVMSAGVYGTIALIDMTLLMKWR